MKSPVKIFAVMVALGAAFVAGPGLAQDATPPTGGAGEGVAIKGFVSPGGSDGSRTGAPPSPAGEGKEGAVATNRGIDPVRAESGAAGLQRRANLKALIANPPKMPMGSPASNAGIGSPPGRPGAVGGSRRDAIGVVVPGGGQGFGHTVPGSTASAGIGGHSLGSGVVGAGAPTGNVGGADARRSTIPPNPVMSPAAHMSGINGTTMGHISSGPSYVGGPAKDRSGINGTAVRPKH